MYICRISTPFKRCTTVQSTATAFALRPLPRDLVSKLLEEHTRDTWVFGRAIRKGEHESRAIREPLFYEDADHRACSGVFSWSQGFSFFYFCQETRRDAYGNIKKWENGSNDGLTHMHNSLGNLADTNPKHNYQSEGKLTQVDREARAVSVSGSMLRPRILGLWYH